MTRVHGSRMRTSRYDSYRPRSPAHDTSWIGRAEKWSMDQLPHDGRPYTVAPRGREELRRDRAAGGLLQVGAQRYRNGRRPSRDINTDRYVDVLEPGQVRESPRHGRSRLSDGLMTGNRASSGVSRDFRRQEIDRNGLRDWDRIDERPRQRDYDSRQSQDQDPDRCSRTTAPRLPAYSDHGASRPHQSTSTAPESGLRLRATEARKNGHGFLEQGVSGVVATSRPLESPASPPPEPPISRWCPVAYHISSSQLWTYSPQHLKRGTRHFAYLTEADLANWCDVRLPWTAGKDTISGETVSSLGPSSTSTAAAPVGRLLCNGTSSVLAPGLNQQIQPIVSGGTPVPSPYAIPTSSKKRPPGGPVDLEISHAHLHRSEITKPRPRARLLLAGKTVVAREHGTRSPGNHASNRLPSGQVDNHLGVRPPPEPIGPDDSDDESYSPGQPVRSGGHDKSKQGLSRVEFADWEDVAWLLRWLRQRPDCTRRDTDTITHQVKRAG